MKVGTGLIIGLLVGGMIGVLTMVLCIAAKNDPHTSDHDK